MVILIDFVHQICFVFLIFLSPLADILLFSVPPIYEKNQVRAWPFDPLTSSRRTLYETWGWWIIWTTQEWWWHHCSRGWANQRQQPLLSDLTRWQKSSMLLEIICTLILIIGQSSLKMQSHTHFSMFPNQWIVLQCPEACCKSHGTWSLMFYLMISNLGWTMGHYSILVITDLFWPRGALTNTL